MSDVGEVVAAGLGAASGLTALIGSRIYPKRIPQGALMPACTYQVIAGPRVSAFGADSGIARPRVQVNAWAATYTEARRVITQVRLALQRYRGTLAGVEVLDIFVENELDLEDDDVFRFGVAMDFEVIHREA